MNRSPTLVFSRRREAQVVEVGEEDSPVVVLPRRVSFRRGFVLCRERQDEAWSLTDCISFVVTRDRDLRSALTADSDFEQAGFRALLRE